MAIPSYTTDLTDIADLDSSGGTAVEPLSLYSGGRSPVEDDTDFPIQGTVHASLTLNAVAKGGIFVPGDSWTYTAGEYIFGWVIWLAPSTINTYANGGLSILLGSSASVFNVYHVGGSDRAPNPYGGWQNIAILPTMTPSENAGTPTAYHYVGAAVDCISKVSKGNPLGFDAFRYGRGEILVDNGSSGDGYATFAGMAAVNDNNSNMWGLFQAIEGGYKWKGLMSFGSVAATEFTDANASIVIDNTEWVASNFNRIEINNSSSIIAWTAINISALGTLSKGEFEMIDNATVDIVSCTFTDMSTFVFQSNAELVNTTFRRCGLVTQGSAIFTLCTFDKPSGAVGLNANELDDITDCTFNSNGTGHAIDLGTIVANDSVAWVNLDTGYTDASSGNETILVSVNNGITLTINVATGSSTPSVYNTGSGTVTVVTGAVDININVKDQAAADINGALVYIDEDLESAGNIVNTTTDGNGDVNTSYSGVATTATVRIRLYGYKPYVGTISLASDSNTNVTLITDPQQI